MFSKHPTLTVFLIALALRLLYFGVVSPWQPEVQKTVIIKKDAVGYHQIAKNYLDMGIHTKSQYLPHNPDKVRVPLYPMFLAGVYGVFGEKPWLALLFQILIGAFTSVIVYKTARYYISESAAFLAGLLYCLDYTAIFYTSNLLTETLFILFLVLHIYFLTLFFTASNSPRGYPERVLSGVEASTHKPINSYTHTPIHPFTRNSHQQSDISDQRSAVSDQRSALRNQKPEAPSIFHLSSFIFNLKTPSLFAPRSSLLALLFSGIFLAAATLTRPVTAYWFIFLLPIFLLQHKMSLHKRILTFFLVTFTFFLAITPWLIRNYDVSGKIMISNQQQKAVNWALPKLAHSWRHPDSPSAWELKDFIHDAKHLGTGVLQLFTTIGSSGLPRMLGIDYHHTVYKDQQAGLIHLIIATLKKKPPIQIAIIVLMIPVLLMIYISTITGIVHAWRNRGFRHIALLLFIIGYIIMTAAGFANTERFRLPLMPFLYIFAAHGMAVIYNKWQGLKKDNNAIIITRQPRQNTTSQHKAKPTPSPIGN